MYTPQRLFGEAQSSSDILTHEPFLERAQVQREQADDGSARLALGAYVVARLVDKRLALTSDIPALWNAPDTTNVDRKQIVRCLVEGFLEHGSRIPARQFENWLCDIA